VGGENIVNKDKKLAILERYLAYRKCGMISPVTTEGDTIIRRNELLLVAMAQYKRKNK